MNYSNYLLAIADKFLALVKAKGKPKKSSPGQLCLPWAQWEVNRDVRAVAEKFVLANCYNPQFASIYPADQSQIMLPWWENN